MGIRTSTIAQTLRTFFYGYSTNDYGDENFWEGEDDYPIRVQLNREERDDLSVFERLMVPTETGKLVRLSTVARIVEAEGLPQITRKDRQRYLTVGANLQGRSLGEVTKEISRKLSEMELPEGVRISFGGQVKEQKDAFTQMGYLVLLGILLVYMVMAGLYEAYLDPLVIMFSIPFALTGVVFAYLVTGIYLSLQGMLGIIMLIGIVVNIAIVLVDYINLLRARGKKIREAIIEAGRRRLRSVLMTTLTTFFGMLPMAVSRGEGAEIWRPLAVSVMGGLLVSMFVTLLLIPVMYYLVEEKIRRQKRFVEAKEVA
jgi:HAE1 family hydrophobic/amphiphilic exporter-1